MVKSVTAKSVRSLLIAVALHRHISATPLFLHPIQSTAINSAPPHSQPARSFLLKPRLNELKSSVSQLSKSFRTNTTRTKLATEITNSANLLIRCAEGGFLDIGTRHTPFLCLIMTYAELSTSFMHRVNVCRISEILKSLSTKKRPKFRKCNNNDHSIIQDFPSKF